MNIPTNISIADQKTLENLLETFQQVIQENNPCLTFSCYFFLLQTIIRRGNMNMPSNISIANQKTLDNLL